MPEKEFNAIFSKQLRHYLALNDMTQLELARRLGVGTTSVYNWCNGIKTPRMDKVDAMCQIFQCRRSDLMTDPDIEHSTDISFSEEEKKHIQKYRTLDEYGKKNVDTVLDNEYTRCQETKVTPLHETPDPYKIHTLAAHERPGATEEDKKKDYDMMNDPDIWGDIE